MESPHVHAKVEAARVEAAALGLPVEDAVVLHASNRVTVRLLPCDVVVRVAPPGYGENAAFEIAVAQQLAQTESPVATLEPRVEPRVYARDGFVMNMWRYYEPAADPDIAPAAYAQAFHRLHAGLRGIDLPAPHFTDRIAEAQRLVGNPDLTPELGNPDRAFLGGALQYLRQTIAGRGAPEQLLHGEPHPGNLLNTADGPLFIDFETVCRGPVEFDIAHAPDAVSDHYPGIDQELLRACRNLMLALVASWRWDKDDQFPNGRQMGLEMLGDLRKALELEGDRA